MGKGNLLSITLLTLLAVTGSALASTSSTSVAVTPYWPDKNTAFFGITVGGSALNQHVWSRFDTEGVTFIVPDGCVNMANVTVINPHIADEWGHWSELVEGNITLFSADNSTTYTAKMPFFAELNKPCTTGAAGAFINFGAQMSLFNNPQANASTAPISRLCTATGTCSFYTTTSAASTGQNTKAPNCVGGFFGYYHYPAGTTPGFTLNLSGAQPALTIGLTNPSNAPMPGNLFYQLPNRSMYPCIGSSAPLPDCTGVQYWGTTIPHVTVQIGTVSIPTSQAMVDTGDNIMLLRDDGAGTYASELQSVLGACPKAYTYLTGCKCILPNQSIAVSQQGANGTFQYSYAATDLSKNQRMAIAICPNSAFNAGGTAPFIFPNGVNLGFAFFSSVSSVTYDFNACTINAMGAANNGTTSN